MLGYVLLSPYTTYATCKDLTPIGVSGKFGKFQGLPSSEADLGYFMNLLHSNVSFKQGETMRRPSGQ